MGSAIFFFAILFCVFISIHAQEPDYPRNPSCITNLPFFAGIECFSWKKDGRDAPPIHELLGRVCETRECTSTVQNIGNTVSLKLYGGDFSLTSQALQQFPNLKELKITGRNTSTGPIRIDSNILQGKTKMVDVVLRNVKLPSNLNDVMRPVKSTVENVVIEDTQKDVVNAFAGFSKLKLFNVINAGLTEFPTDALRSSASTLTRLFLKSNKIRSLNADHVRVFTKLEDLHLGNNEISSLATDTFANLRKLESLNLSGNRITNLSPDMFRSNTKLRSLNLNRNPTTGLTREQFASLSSVQSLMLPDDDFGRR